MVRPVERFGAFRLNYLGTKKIIKEPSGRRGGAAGPRGRCSGPPAPAIPPTSLRRSDGTGSGVRCPALRTLNSNLPYAQEYRNGEVCILCGSPKDERIDGKKIDGSCKTFP